MDEYADIAPFYDLEHDGFTDDVDFYKQLLYRGPVVEVGCGTGRIMSALLSQGLEVWGIEPSPSMLARARARIGPHPLAHFFNGFLADFTSERIFAGALIPLNTLWHMDSIDARLAGLGRLRQCLADEAILVVDQSNPLALVDRGASGDMRQRFSRARDDGFVHCFSTAWDDQGEQRLDLDLIYDITGDDAAVRRYRAHLCLRYVYRYELELLLRAAGFHIQAVYGSYDLDPYTSESANILVVARAIRALTVCI